MSERAPISARCMWMRGGTSKGGYFLADELPQDVATRDAFLVNTDLDVFDGGERVFCRSWSDRIARDQV